MRHRSTLAVVVGIVVTVLLLHPARPETASPTVQQLAAQLDALQATVGTLQATVNSQAGQITTLQATVTSQAADIASLQATVSNHTSGIGSLQSDVGGLQDKLQFVSVDGTEMYITGANLNIRNGNANGNTWGGDPDLPNDIHVNGLGNLIVGYNEGLGVLPKGGSHNIVVVPRV
jgi:uncharacterized coiled-coil protein SlyX